MRPRLRAGGLLAVTAGLTVWFSLYAATHLRVDTDTEGMFSPDTAFRRSYAELKRQFPQLQQTLLIVIDGSEPGEVARLARALRSRLEQDETFSTVDDPRGDAYFRSRGVLFLPLESIESLVETLVRAKPLLAGLAQDPTVAGLARFLQGSLPWISLAGEAGAEGLAALLAEVGRAVEAAGAGREEPVSWEAMLSVPAGPQQTTRRVLVTQPRLDFEALLPAQRAIDEVRSWVAELEVPDDVRVRLTGEVALLHEELLSSEKGVQRSAILSLLLVTTLLRIALGSWRLVVFSLAALVMGLAWTAAFAALVVGELNLISIAFAVLYISLGIDGSIHFCARYQELAAAGGERRATLKATIREVGVSLLLAATTTAFGFLAFTPTSFSAVADLGIIASGGIFISLIVNLTVLPALLTIFGARLPAPPTNRHTWEDRLGGLLQRHRTGVRLGASLAGLIALVVCFQASFDPDPHRLRDPDTESVSTFDELAEDPEVTPLRAHLLAGSRAEADQKARALESLPEVAAVVTVDDFVPESQPEKIELLSELPALPRLGPPEGVPDVTEGLAALESLEGALRERARGQGPASTEMTRLAEAIEGFLARARVGEADGRRMLARLQRNLFVELPPLLEQVDEMRTLEPAGIDDLPRSTRVRWISEEGVYRLDAIPRADLDDPVELERFVAAVRSVDPAATGAPVISQEAGGLAVEAFQTAFLLALGANLLLLVVIFRHPLDVLAVLGTLILGGLLTGAVAVLLGLDFNFANVIALPLLLGLGIDSGIHMVHRHRLRLSSDRSLLRTSTSRAVLFSALTTVGGFGTLALSPHVGTASLGLLLAVGIGSVLLCTIIVLPVLPLSPGRRATASGEG